MSKHSAACLIDFSLSKISESSVDGGGARTTRRRREMEEGDEGAVEGKCRFSLSRDELVKKRGVKCPLVLCPALGGPRRRRHTYTRRTCAAAITKKRKETGGKKTARNYLVLQ